MCGVEIHSGVYLEKQSMATGIEVTMVTPGLDVPTTMLENLCVERDPRCVEFGCFLLHSSQGDAELAIHRAIDGMFDDPNVRAVQAETAECIRAVAVAAMDLRLGRHVRGEIEKHW